mgnify:CR=1 FL=1
MRANRFTVIVDTCVLYPALTRNIVLSLANEGLFRPRWSTEILNELQRNLNADFPERGVGDSQRKNIEIAFPEGEIEVSERLVESLSLPDAKDRHVLAAAIRSRAALIVTNNLKDFPEEELNDYEVEGDGVVQDYAEALKWYRLAAEQGSPYAQHNLGVMYENGNGVVQDNIRSHMWYNIAAANGIENAFIWRDEIAAKMTSADIAEAQAIARECMSSGYKNCAW